MDLSLESWVFWACPSVEPPWLLGFQKKKKNRSHPLSMQWKPKGYWDLGGGACGLPSPIPFCSDLISLK